jgi:aryl-alcohol dehydrogenase-like predicted oxidoreductase
MASRGEIPKRPFGRHPELVSALALGGYHIGVIPHERDAIRLVHAAIDAGVTFMDNAWDYNEGTSEKRMGKALKGRRDRVFLMTKVCTHGRDARVAMRQLEESLRRLQTDYLDLWQIHECVYYNEPALHFAKGGVVEALDRAKADGKVRFVGFTGHKDPDIHLQMLSYGYPFDGCQLPLNAFDANFRSFERRVLPELARQGIAAIGMKSLGGGGEPVKGRAVKAREALRYGRHNGQRHGIDADPAAESRRRPGLPADVAPRDGGLPAAVRGARQRRAFRAVQDDGAVRRLRRSTAARLSAAPISDRLRPARSPMSPSPTGAASSSSMPPTDRTGAASAAAPRSPP